MKIHAFRLTRGQDLKKGIEDYQKAHNIEAGCIVTCVGCIYECCLRVADGKTLYKDSTHYEIVSLTGTLAPQGVHLHISLSDANLKTIGGHLMNGCLVNTTTEIVLMEIDEYRFNREFDETTGYDELVVSK